MKPPLSRSSRVRTDARPARRIKALLPLLIMAAVVAAIAVQEVPAVRDLYQQWSDPEGWSANQACQQAALALAARSEHARIVSAGVTHETQGGFFIEALRVGEMADEGGERQFEVSCYTDSAGQVVRADRVGS